MVVSTLFPASAPNAGCHQQWLLACAGQAFLSEADENHRVARLPVTSFRSHGVAPLVIAAGFTYMDMKKSKEIKITAYSPTKCLKINSCHCKVVGALMMEHDKANAIWPGRYRRMEQFAEWLVQKI